MINLKNEDNQCFRRCHITHLNPPEKYPQRVKKTDKQYIDKLDYPRIEFPVSVKQYNRIEKQKNINDNVFDYEAKQPFQSIYQKNNLKMR